MALTLTSEWSISQSCVPTRLLLAGAGRALLLAGQALDARGSAVWVIGLSQGRSIRQVSFENALISGMISIEDQHVLVATHSADGVRPTDEVVALDTQGAIQWRWAANSLSVSTPAVRGKDIFVTVDGQFLIQLDSAIHTEQARRPLPAGVKASLAAPMIQGDFIYISCQSPHMVALSRQGELRWQFTLPQATPTVWLQYTPLIVGASLYTVTSKGEVIQINAESSALGWRMTLDLAGKSPSPLATDGESLFVGAGNGVYALRPTDGSLLWHFATQRRISAAPVVAQGIVYAGCHDHRVYALEATSGAQLWEHEMPQGIEISPALSPDHTQIFVADRKGTVAMLALPLSAEQYEAAGRWREAAQMWAAAGQGLNQAKALEELAQVLAKNGHAEAEQASVWHEAARLYQSQGEHERAETCRREAARCGHEPILILDFKGEGLQEKKGSSLQLIVRNVGYGLAQNILLHRDERKKFAGGLGESREFYALKPGDERIEWVDVYPEAHGDVSLRVTIEYQDSAGQSYKHTQTFFLQVTPAPMPEAVAAVILKAQGNINIGGDVVGRDKNEVTK